MLGWVSMLESKESVWGRYWSLWLLRSKWSSTTVSISILYVSLKKEEIQNEEDNYFIVYFYYHYTVFIHKVKEIKRKWYQIKANN